eukprot:65458_1
MFPTQQIQNLNELTIRLETMIFDCYDINGNVIQNYVEKNAAIPKQIHLPTDVTYEWKIWKSHKMNEIKNAKNGETFYSNPFKMEKLLKWRLKLYPFGSNDNKIIKNKECVEVFLELTKWPFFKIQKIVVIFELFVKEINRKFINCVNFSAKNLSWGIREICKSEVIGNLNELTISVRMVILNVYDINGNLVDDYNKNNKYKLTKHIYRNISIKNE